MAKGSIAVLIGGIATQALAILCWYWSFRLFNADLLKLWFNIILPFGAVALGLLGALGFGLTGRLVKATATRGLKLAAVGIAVCAVVAIRYLGYWLLEFQGVRVHELIGFGTYLTETLGHTRMDFSHRSQGLGSIDIGPIGYLMELLQTAAYAATSYGLVANLPKAIRCEPCDRWMRDDQSGELFCSDHGRFRAMHEGLPAGGAERLSALRAAPSESGKPAAGTLRLSWRVSECPRCSNAALGESGALFNGNYFASVSVLTRLTRFVRGRTPPPPRSPDGFVGAPPRSFGRRTVP